MDNCRSKVRDPMCRQGRDGLSVGSPTAPTAAERRAEDLVRTGGWVDLMIVGAQRSLRRLATPSDEVRRKVMS